MIDDKSWIEDDDHDFHWVLDDADEAAAASEETATAPASPAPTVVTPPLNDADLALFQKTFSQMVILFMDVKEVARSVSGWLRWQRPVYREEEALYALKNLEDQGKLRIHNNVVYVPDAYDILEKRL